MKNRELIDVLLQADLNLEVRVVGHGWVQLTAEGTISVRESLTLHGAVLDSDLGRVLLVTDVVANA